MPLTTKDLTSIKQVTTQVITEGLAPIHAQIVTLSKDVDTLAMAASQQFQVIISRLDNQDAELADIKEDVAVVKDIVKDHSFRIAKLEHKTA